MNRRMKWLGIVGVLVFVVVSTAHTSSLQYGDADLEVNGSPVLTAATNGGLTGEIVTASAVVGNSSSGTVYTTPATGEFVLVQVCILESTLASPTGVLEGTTMGKLANENCIEYYPGLLIPQNETLSLTDNPNPSGSTVVTITGVYSAG